MRYTHREPALTGMKLKILCQKFPKLFHQEGKNLTFINLVKHKIQTTDEIPLHTKPFRNSPVERQEIQRQINKLLDQDIIRHSHSPWSAPIFIVSKKPDAANNKKWRLIIDYRKLNEKTIKDKYPMPNITDVLDRIGRAKYFTALDLADTTKWRWIQETLIKQPFRQLEAISNL